MGSENQSSVRPGELEIGIDGGRKSSVSGNSNGSQTGSSNIKSDSFVVDIDRFCLPVVKDINGSSRIRKLQRNLSRKGSGKCGEKKINSIPGANERDACMLSSARLLETPWNITRRSQLGFHSKVKIKKRKTRRRWILQRRSHLHMYFGAKTVE